MGYTTTFKGMFNIEGGEISEEIVDLINGIARTRRMKRDVGKLAEELGISSEECEARYFSDGQLYFTPNEEDNGQTDRKGVVDANSPPAGQPTLWCHWIYDPKKKGICWDGGDKFYYYTEWLEYLIRVILAPTGIVLNGKVTYVGEDADNDQGYIEVKNNEVTRYIMVKTFVPEDKTKRLEPMKSFTTASSSAEMESAVEENL